MKQWEEWERRGWKYSTLERNLCEGVCVYVCVCISCICLDTLCA